MVLVVFEEMLRRVWEMLHIAPVALGIALQVKELCPGVTCEEVVRGSSHEVIQLVVGSPGGALAVLVGGVRGCRSGSNKRGFSSNVDRG